MEGYSLWCHKESDMTEMAAHTQMDCNVRHGEQITEDTWKHTVGPKEYHTLVISL